MPLYTLDQVLNSPLVNWNVAPQAHELNHLRPESHWGRDERRLISVD